MGDTWNGVVVGYLLERDLFERPGQITPATVREAATIASRASAKVGARTASRLSPVELRNLRIAS
ncbi:MAG: hypothetical protein AAB553_03250 [Patescibacteria group bacterium]